jgi:hypothetical protein
MQSELVPGFLYRDTGREITETDLDVVSDLWTIDGREVYRGSRDPRYTHAHVYWLYSQDLERVGLSEHTLTDQADFRVLWFRDTEFGTYLQEDGWEMSEDIWASLPRHVFDRFLNEGWTTPQAFLEQCLHGSLRILTPSMLTPLPTVYTCSVCGKRSLRQSPGCKVSAAPLDFPTTEKVLFVDDDLIVYRPPPTSRVWSYLTPPQPSHDGDSQREPQRPELPVQPEPQSEPTPPPPESAETPPPRAQPPAAAEGPLPPPQSHP